MIDILSGEVIDMLGLVLKASRELQEQLRAKAALPGHQREAPGSNPPASVPGQLAHGHPVSDSPPGGDPYDPAHIDTHMWLQPPKEPENFTTVRPQPPSVDVRALGSSISEHLDMHIVPLQRINAAGAAGTSNQPSGDPSSEGAETGHADYQTAPTGVGAQFRQSPSGRGGLPYMPAPGGP